MIGPRNRAAILLVVAQLVSAGCAAGDVAVDTDSAAPDGAAADTVSAVSQQSDLRIPPVVNPGALATVASTPVQWWTGPGGAPFEVTIRTSDPASAHTRRFGTITLLTSIRSRTLGQYPCTSCHLGRKMVLKDERIADAHRDIQPEHPALTGATCSTCHAADNVELLALKSGERATLDHTYRLCAQCHFAQTQAWSAGAHGKRLDGWQGRRVVMGCADCHDPHKPTIEQRVPFRAPQIVRTRSRER